jgi:hypothetical protein
LDGDLFGDGRAIGFLAVGTWHQNKHQWASR